MMFSIIIINIFYNITVEFFLCADQGLDPSFKSKSKQRIFLYHVFIKIPDFLRLCSKEIIVFKQFPELDQEIGMDEIYFIVILLCFFLQIHCIIS